MSSRVGSRTRDLRGHSFSLAGIRVFPAAAIALLAAALLAVTGATAPCATAYTWDTGSTGTSQVLYSVSALDASHVWAVGGAAGTIRFYNGHSWKGQAAGTDARLYGVSALDGSHVWAVGYDYVAAVPVVRFFDGHSWTGQNSGATVKLWSVSALDASHVWACGNAGNIRFFNGGSWSGQASGTPNDISGISAADSQHVWGCGTNGTIRFFNGSGWSGQSSGTSEVLIGIHALDASHVWAVGNSGTILFYDGHSWDEQESGTSAQLHSVFAIDSRHVFAAGENGTLLFYNGSSWSDQDTGTGTPLSGVGAAGTGEAWVVGSGGLVLYGKPPAPVLTSTSPAFGGSGTVVTISGHDFFPERGSSYVSFRGVNATRYVSWDDREIKVIVPDLPAAYGGSGMTGGSSIQVKVTTSGGTSGGKAFGVTSPTWYLAEGSTAWGFSDYMTIENPNSGAVTAKVTYMPSGSSNVNETITLPALSQTTLTNDHLVKVMGGPRDFSTKVESKAGYTIAVDRTMTWTGPGAASEEGHNSIGVNAPAKTWYLPEGSSAWGFECWLLVQNPNSKAATCKMTYMIEGAGPQQFTRTVPAHSRASFNMADDIGSHDASIEVASDVPVIPERAMYRNNRREGHDSIGTTSPAKDYYLAEGATGYNVGYVTYVLVQNPQSSPTDVTLTYQTQNGEVAGPSFQMAANSRKTLRVNDQLSPNTDVSTRVHGSKPIIAERSMYWDNGTGEATHDSIGMSAPHRMFYLPDGWAAGWYETWTLVQNPNDTDVKVQVTYLPPYHKIVPGPAPLPPGVKSFTATIPANSRLTFNMADQVKIDPIYPDQDNYKYSIVVECKTQGKKIMCERSMYWNNRGAGTDTVGGFSD